MESGFSNFHSDLLNYRAISNLIAKKSGIEHQSPQLIVFQMDYLFIDASHNGIVIDDIFGFVEVLLNKLNLYFLFNIGMQTFGNWTSMCCIY
ncbi:MAG: DUF2847 family protein [Saprospirales bacterium]|nr:DUF2847 family protein [Saprospirales bacterium]